MVFPGLFMWKVVFLGLSKKTTEGTIDVPMNGLSTVRTSVFFGFGPIMITARVDALEKTATGTQVIIFSMVDDGKPQI